MKTCTFFVRVIRCTEYYMSCDWSLPMLYTVYDQRVGTQVKSLEKCFLFCHMFCPTWCTVLKMFKGLRDYLELNKYKKDLGFLQLEKSNPCIT